MDITRTDIAAITANTERRRYRLGLQYPSELPSTFQMVVAVVL
jgi:hypothetical protein